jgi:LPS export ABC transporter permease LptG/LPS export ABC transporter permease LptF
MLKIDKILYRAIIPPFLITLVVLTFVVFIHELGSRSEWLFARGASIDVILTGMCAIFPAILIFSLPLSFLIGVLIGLSGMSGESQITALRACGVPLRTLLRFILALGAFVGAITAILSLIILPQTNNVIRRVQNRISLTQATAMIQPRVFNEDFPNIVFYVDDIPADRQYLSKIFLLDNSDPRAPQTIIADTATWVSDSSNQRLQLHLERCASYAVNPEDPSKDNVSYFPSADIPIRPKSDSASLQINQQSRKVAEQSSMDLWRNHLKAPPSERLNQLIELNRRLALPFSIFPFALLGLTLAVSAPKGGRTLGFVLSLAMVILFYMLFLNGLRLAAIDKISPWIGAWSANILLSLAGLLLMAKAEQSATIGQWISILLWKSKWDKLFQRFRLQKMRRRIGGIEDAVFPAARGFFRFLFPKILDLYIFKNFLVFFFWSLIACGTLFVMFTLFELLDDIIHNGIPIEEVMEYFTFLTPQILMVAIPMSVLLGILISFGILEKNSEITAIKAGGWSLYRIAIPVFLIASIFCISMFLVQDYVLPYANERQDSLHNIIKGRPAQTSRLQRKWIFGDSSRIYNYKYFDPKQDSFLDLNVYDVDFPNGKILCRTHAGHASINQNGEWTLENGWIRNYDKTKPTFELISTKTKSFPEKARYFETGIFQPKESSKMTYSELMKYINYLKKSGYTAVGLQVEAHKKISFPLSCLVIALLGLPFSFSMGKKGAFFGIGVSIAIAIAYQGISGIFEAMGAYGLLVPVLAAWAPNILFGAAGLVMLFTIRT